MHETHFHSDPGPSQPVGSANPSDAAVPFPGTESHVGDDAPAKPERAEKKPSWSAKLAAKKAASATSAGGDEPPKKRALPWDVRLKIAVVLSFVILVSVLIIKRPRTKTPADGSLPVASVPNPAAEDGEAGKLAETATASKADPATASQSAEPAEAPDKTVLTSAAVPGDPDKAKEAVAKLAPPADAEKLPADGRGAVSLLSGVAAGSIPPSPQSLEKTPADLVAAEAGSLGTPPPLEAPPAHDSSTAPSVPPAIAFSQTTTATEAAKPLIQEPPPGGQFGPDAVNSSLPQPPPKLDLATPPRAEPEIVAGAAVAGAAAAGAVAAGAFSIPNAGPKSVSEGASGVSKLDTSANTVADKVPVRQAPSSGGIEPIVHVVKRGENFWTIARYHYGDGRLYKALWYANREQVKAPEDLYIGTAVRVPAVEDLNRALIEPAKTAKASSGRQLASIPDEVPDLDPRAEKTSNATGAGVVMLPVADPTKRNAEEIRRPATSSSRGKKSLEPAVRSRTVKKHETLRSIARDELGDPNREREIWSLNKDEFADQDAPYRLKAGMVLKLPDDTRRR